MPLDTPKVLISGSVAYDFILQYDRPFVDQLIEPPKEQLNLGLCVNHIRREFGGCAGNIAYSLSLLGQKPYIMSAVGSDASDYLIRIDQLGINREFLRLITGSLTSRSFSINDSVKSQISVFHPGAMTFTDHHTPDMPFDLAILAPSDAPISYAHAQSLLAQQVPFIFDPGPTVSFLTQEELIFLMSHSLCTIVNINEMQRLAHATGRSEEEWATAIPALIVTLGDKGSRLHYQQHIHHIPVIPVENFADPTGCGDAYRAGLIHALMANWPWEKAAQLGSVVGSFCARFIGAQNHNFTQEHILHIYHEHFGDPLPL